MTKRHKRFLPIGSPVRTREIVLVVLLIILAIFAVYVSRGNSTAFGLLSEPIQKKFPLVVANFHTDVLEDPALLSLDIDTTDTQVSQINGMALDVRTPPAPKSVEAYTDRTGSGVIVEWVIPESALTLTANVYRSQADGKVQSVATHLVDTTFRDDTVIEGETYIYTIHLCAYDADADTWYESDLSRSVTVIAQDTLAPSAPTHVTITNDDSLDAGAQLIIAWTHPAHADVVRIYRSTQFGVRGVLLTTVDTDEDAQFIDADVLPNQTYWYTLVSVDAAGNVSSDDFSIPTPGNAHPFDYPHFGQ